MLPADVDTVETRRSPPEMAPDGLSATSQSSGPFGVENPSSVDDAHDRLRAPATNPEPLVVFADRGDKALDEDGVRRLPSTRRTPFHASRE